MRIKLTNSENALKASIERLTEEIRSLQDARKATVDSKLDSQFLAALREKIVWASLKAHQLHQRLAERGLEPIHRQHLTLKTS